MQQSLTALRQQNSGPLGTVEQNLTSLTKAALALTFLEKVSLSLEEALGITFSKPLPQKIACASKRWGVNYLCD